MAPENHGVECTVENSVIVQKSPDVGVLSCGVGEICIEDSTSSVGGRCMVLVADDEPALELQEERQLSCKKCEGNLACYKVDQSRIPCGSCNGVGACYNLSNDVTIGANSCLAQWACAMAEVTASESA
eukprot:scaffold116902_cov58-Cyclotella_meneghiniana.AAC.2